MTVVLKDVSLLELMSHMPTCRKCNQTYHQSHFISGNGPRYLICGRCAVEDGLVSPEEAPQYYSDELARARLVLYSKRYRPLAFTSAGWILFLTMGRYRALVWSFLRYTAGGHSSCSVVHLLGSARFKAELAKLTPESNTGTIQISNIALEV